MGLNLLLERSLPGEIVEGTQLSNGSRLKYNMNGHLQFWICLLLMGHAVPRWISNNGTISIYGFSPLPLYLVYDHYLQLITLSILGAFVLSIYLYASSFLPGSLLAKGGNTRNSIYDFFIGRLVLLNRRNMLRIILFLVSCFVVYERELNPRIGSLDLKEYCELRPGLIGWAVLNLGTIDQNKILYSMQRNFNFHYITQD
jgi:delta14-sterol reductase/lamin-B receptor